MKTKDIKPGQQYLFIDHRNWYLRDHFRSFRRLTVTSIEGGKVHGFIQWVEAEDGVLKTTRLGKSEVSVAPWTVHQPWEEFSAQFTANHEHKHAAHREAKAARARVEELVGGKKAASKTALSYRFEPKIHNDGSVSRGEDSLSLGQLLELLEMAHEQGRQSTAKQA